MYMIEDMIDMGLNEGQEWPSDDHRIVAQNLGLFNSLVVTRNALNEVVQQVCKIPMDRIRTITIIDCATEFEVPYIRLS